MRIKGTDIRLTNQADTGLGVGQSDSFPVGDDTAPRSRDAFERWMAGVQELLTGRQELSFRAKGIGGLGFLLARECFSGAEPGESQPHSGHRGANATGC